MTGVQTCALPILSTGELIADVDSWFRWRARGRRSAHSSPACPRSPAGSSNFHLCTVCNNRLEPSGSLVAAASLALGYSKRALAAVAALHGPEASPLEPTSTNLGYSLAPAGPPLARASGAAGARRIGPPGNCVAPLSPPLAQLHLRPSNLNAKETPAMKPGP